MITVDFKVGNKVVASFTMNPAEIANIAEHNVENNTYKAPAESEQNNIDKFNSIETIDWQKVKEFVEKNNIPLTEKESGVLDFYIKYGKVSSAQAIVLGYVLKNVQKHGFQISYPF